MEKTQKDLVEGRKEGRKEGGTEGKKEGGGREGGSNNLYSQWRMKWPH